MGQHCSVVDSNLNKKNSEGKRAEKATSVFKDPEVAETLSTLQDKCVVVPADKASNNLVLICKKDYRYN